MHFIRWRGHLAKSLTVFVFKPSVRWRRRQTRLNPHPDKATGWCATSSFTTVPCCQR